jgi:plasmid stabilization system protein ParE
LNYTVRFSPFAKEDKKSIKTYLSKFYPGTARRFSASLKKHIANLKDNPYIYPEYPENPNYRRMFVGNYIVFYKINEAEEKMDVFRAISCYYLTQRRRDDPSYFSLHSCSGRTARTKVLAPYRILKLFSAPTPYYLIHVHSYAVPSWACVHSLIIKNCTNVHFLLCE